MTTYLRPDTMDGVVAALAADPGARPLAGGSDLMNQLRLGAVRPGSMGDLSPLASLAGVQADGGVVRIGAMTTMRDLLAAPAPAGELPALQDAAALLGGRQIQA